MSSGQRSRAMAVPWDWIQLMPSEVPIADSRMRDSKVADRRNTNQRVWLFCRRQNLREERDSHPSGPRWCSARLDLLTFQTLREREREPCNDANSVASAISLTSTIAFRFGSCESA